MKSHKCQNAFFSCEANAIVTSNAWKIILHHRYYLHITQKKRLKFEFSTSTSHTQTLTHIYCERSQNCVITGNWTEPNQQLLVHRNISPASLISRAIDFACSFFHLSFHNSSRTKSKRAESNGKMCFVCKPHTINSMSITKCQKHKPNQVQIYIWICLEICCYFFVVFGAWCSKQPYGLLTYHSESIAIKCIYRVHMWNNRLVSVSFLFISNGRKNVPFCLSVQPLKNGNWTQYSFFVIEINYEKMIDWEMVPFNRTIFFGPHVPNLAIVLLLFRVVVVVVLWCCFCCSWINAWCEWRHENT